MIPSEKIIIALDTNEEEKALSILNEISGYDVWVKIGMELFYSTGQRIVHEAKERGFRVFLDLKLHDIPSTVEKGVSALCKLPIDMINIHAAGGSEMMRRAAVAAKSSRNSPLLMAVTQLTSTTLEQMNREQRIPGDLVESVAHYSKLAKDSGCDGVVSSPHEVQAIKLICGSHFLTVTPGIRPGHSDLEDQKRVTTPQEALLLGTDFMVIGRPITQSPSARVALEHILRGY